MGILVCKCENCGQESMGVYDTMERNGIIYRRRKCAYCGNRISTVEIQKDFYDNCDKIIKMKDKEKEIFNLFENIVYLGNKAKEILNEI